MPSKDQYLAEMLAPLLTSEINQLNIVLVFTLPVNYQKSFVASHLQNRGHSVHIKEASDAPDGELKVSTFLFCIPYLSIHKDGLFFAIFLYIQDAIILQQIVNEIFSRRLNFYILIMIFNFFFVLLFHHYVAWWTNLMSLD